MTLTSKHVGSRFVISHISTIFLNNFDRYKKKKKKKGQFNDELHF